MSIIYFHRNGVSSWIAFSLVNNYVRYQISQNWIFFLQQEWINFCPSTVLESQSPIKAFCASIVAHMHLLTAYYGISSHRSVKITRSTDLFPRAENVSQDKLREALTNCLDDNGNFTVMTPEVIASFPGSSPALIFRYCMNYVCPML